MSAREELNMVLKLVKDLQDGLGKERALWAAAIQEAQAELAVERAAKEEARREAEEWRDAAWRDTCQRCESKPSLPWELRSKTDSDGGRK